MWDQYAQQMGYFSIPQQTQNCIPTEVIDWDVVSSIDPELIKKTGDLTKLKPFLSKFVGANLTAYDSVILNHPLAVRLCCILQVALQYMSDVQVQLQEKLTQKESEVTHITREAIKYKAAFQKADSLLKSQIKSYEKCPICMKKFINIEHLDKHIERKHSEHNDEWKSIRNKRPGLKFQQNTRKYNKADVELLMKKIEELQNTIRKDRNNKNLKSQLFDNQEALMKTEEIESERTMTKRGEMQQLLNTAATDLSMTITAWRQQKNPKPKVKKTFNKKVTNVDEVINVAKEFLLREKEVYTEKLIKDTMFQIEMQVKRRLQSIETNANVDDLNKELIGEFNGNLSQYKSLRQMINHKITNGSWETQNRKNVFKPNPLRVKQNQENNFKKEIHVQYDMPKKSETCKKKCKNLNCIMKQREKTKYSNNNSMFKESFDEFNRGNPLPEDGFFDGKWLDTSD